MNVMTPETVLTMVANGVEEMRLQAAVEALTYDQTLDLLDIVSGIQDYAYRRIERNSAK